MNHTAAEPVWSKPTAYERWFDSPLGRAYAASLERVLSVWLAELPRSFLLDVGCGPGLLMERLFPKDAHIIGLDCSAEMVRRASARNRETGKTWQFTVGSVTKIPFADEVFDVVLCVNCLEFVGDRAAAFRELARVLRPTGSAIIGVLNRSSLWEFTRRLRSPFTRSSYYRGRFFSRHELRACCANAGLHVHDLASAVHFPPLAPGPFAGLYERLDRCSQKRYPWGGAVILCRAVKPEKGLVP